MKTYFNRKAFAFLGATAFMLAAVFTVSCKPAVSSNTPAETFAVTFVADEHGELTAEVDGKPIATNAKVEKGSTVTFTATPKNGYTVKNWTIEEGTFVTGTGTEGSLTAKVKITANTKVSVSFSRYKKVALNELHTYLQAASPTDIHYIEVTGLTAADLNGDWSTPSQLGKILKDNSGKKVAVKLSAVSGVTNMQYCFNGCTNLTQVSKIPAGVTEMRGCFSYCTSLTEAPEIPTGVTDMSSCFSHCTSLTEVPEIPTGVTNMRESFNGCTNLTKAPKIPTGVTDMSYCFCDCTSLTKAPVIPIGVTQMTKCFCDCTSLTSAALKCTYNAGFMDAFSGCTSLAADSIKVPSDQLAAYKAGASHMGAQENWFTDK